MHKSFRYITIAFFHIVFVLFLLLLKKSNIFLVIIFVFSVSDELLI